METIGELIARPRDELGMSQTELARELNATAGRQTLTRGEISRWEHGKVSPGPFWLPHLATVLEVPIKDLRLARRMTCVVTAQDFGLSSALPTVDTVIMLGEGDVERREFLLSSAYSVGALALPDLESVTRPVTARAGGARVGAGEVAAVRRMTRALGDAASELGGGHARYLVAQYLTTDVARWLRGSYSERIGRDLYAATAELVHLAAWMAQDEGRHGLAQRYYIQSYRLAEEADDAEGRATALRGLSAQAAQLGHVQEAVRVADAAARWAPRLDDPRVVAWLHGMRAEAAALAGDRTAAIAALSEAERMIDRAPVHPGDSWGAHFTIVNFTRDAGTVLHRVGDLAGAGQQLSAALNAPGPMRQRTRALILAHLGEVRLAQGEIEAACEAWAAFLTAVEGVQSDRTREALRTMRRELQKHRDVLCARDLEERAAAVLDG